MTSIETVGTIVIKILKVVLNIIILILYRTGFQGYFLGVGGTWNLNEEKNPDVEIVASGVFVGYIIYTLVALIALCFASGDHKTTFTDILMNIIGVFMWVAVGATALHYWHGYLFEHKYQMVDSEREVGLAMGSLCIINGAAYLIDSVLGIIFLIKTKLQ
ncbi:protein snakeskin [Anoplophora glabripennis]|uniref:protein snakeskin n=1 Tax=Anoplophora glabripennis TaxID=217634 RepID=UPI0008746319|nr:protein snakeskin [Anoplophora glabripennis]